MKARARNVPNVPPRPQHALPGDRETARPRKTRAEVTSSVSPHAPLPKASWGPSFKSVIILILHLLLVFPVYSCTYVSNVISNFPPTFPAAAGRTHFTEASPVPRAATPAATCYRPQATTRGAHRLGCLENGARSATSTLGFPEFPNAAAYALRGNPAPPAPW